MKNTREKVTNICNNIEAINAIICNNTLHNGILKLSLTEEDILETLVSLTKSNISDIDNIDDDEFDLYIDDIKKFIGNIDNVVKRSRSNKFLINKLYGVI